MEPSFWHKRWESGKINFHASEANALLVKSFHLLHLSVNSRVFVPLCGKTLDISWLLNQGCRVAGVELSELAVSQLFEELGVEPKVSDTGSALKHYSAPNIDIFVGNIFQLTRPLLGTIDAIYDRAALVALPEELRIRYTQHLTDITRNASQLLITFFYDQNLLQGPPFSIATEEIDRHYKNSYKIRCLTSVDVKGGFKGVQAKRNAWLLEKLS